MILARITGEVIAPQKHPHLAHNRLLLVEPIDLSNRLLGPTLIAMDVVDAGVGDTVIVNKEGSSARLIFDDEQIPLQAVVVGVVDRLEVCE